MPILGREYLRVQYWDHRGFRAPANTQPLWHLPGKAHLVTQCGHFFIGIQAVQVSVLPPAHVCVECLTGRRAHGPHPDR